MAAFFPQWHYAHAGSAVKQRRNHVVDQLHSKLGRAEFPVGPHPRAIHQIEGCSREIPQRALRTGRNLFSRLGHKTPEGQSSQPLKITHFFLFPPALPLCSLLRAFNLKSTVESANLSKRACFSKQCSCSAVHHLG